MTMIKVPKPATTIDLQSHLFILHGVYTGDARTKAAKAALSTAHASEHEDAWSHASVPHEHVEG